MQKAMFHDVKHGLLQTAGFQDITRARQVFGIIGGDKGRNWNIILTFAAFFKIPGNEDNTVHKGMDAALRHGVRRVRLPAVH